MLKSVWTALEDWSFSQQMVDEPFWFPALETLHVGALTILVGSMIFVDLRLMGLAGMRETMRGHLRILTVAWAAFIVAAVSGALMFAPAAVRYAGNSAFQWKMLALVLAGLNMLAFHAGPWRSIARWDGAEPPLRARAAGAVSLMLWVAVVILGRYVPFTN